MDDLASINFGEVSFQEAVDALRNLVPMSDEEFEMLNLDAKRRAFTFAGAYSDSAAKAVQNTLAESAAGAISRDEWLSAAQKALEPFDLSLSGYQSQAIYETAMSRAFNDGTMRQVTSSPTISAAYPCAGFDTCADSRVRPNHYALDFRRIKVVFPLNDPIWQLMGLPLGYRCRCSRRFFRPEEIGALGLTVGKGVDWYGRTEEVTVPGGISRVVQILPDPGFGGGAGLTARAGFSDMAITGRLLAVLLTIQSAAPKSLVLVGGDLPGHEFRGYQYTAGRAIGHAVEAAATPGSKLRVQYAPVTQVEADRIKNATSLDVAGYHHEIDTDSIRHIQNQHPDLTPEDFQRIPEIVASPDRITRGLTKQGLASIQYEKVFGRKTIYVEEVRTGREVLAAKTFFKK